MKRNRQKREQKRTTRDFAVEVQQFEVASGYDGLLRGAPEICVVAAIYAVGRRTRTLGRHVFRAETLWDGKYPASVAARDERIVAATDADDEALLVVVAGIEDDGGGGVARVYGALERADHLALATRDHGHDLVSLGDITPAVWGDARRAIVVIDGAPLELSCVEDDWVGAAAVCVPREPGARRHRFHLVSEDGKNDWTMLTTTKVGWRP